jgi:hypothetical protein
MKDIEQLAWWLHGAATEAGHKQIVRDVIGRASAMIQNGYGLPDDDQLDEIDDISTEIRDIIARFAAAWDECERDQREDEASR